MEAESRSSGHERNQESGEGRVMTAVVLLITQVAPPTPPSTRPEVMRKLLIRCMRKTGHYANVVSAQMGLNGC